MTWWNMSEILRAGAIEAIAETLWMMDKPWDYQHRTPWAVESKGQVDVYMAKAVVAFDGGLDFLEAHLEEWEIAMHDAAETAREGGDEIDFMQAVVAALRSGVEETP